MGLGIINIICRLVNSEIEAIKTRLTGFEETHLEVKSTHSKLDNKIEKLDHRLSKLECIVDALEPTLKLYIENQTLKHAFTAQKTKGVLPLPQDESAQR